MQSADSSPDPALSFLTPIGYQSSSCGYCKNDESSQRTPDSRASYYMRSSSLSPEHYQELMDRGWRRSGVLLYLPDASRSCCPHYTIRLPSSDLQSTRDQRQALYRWNRFVLGEQYAREVSLKYPKTKEEKRQSKNSFDLLGTVHESETANLKPDLKPEHNFSVLLEPDTFTEEKYRLYNHYQRNVHHEGDDDISKSGFRRFLCSSPLSRRTEADGKMLGAYHQCYRLDGRLIAMAVLDLLPHAVSGVYFIYHCDFERWSFGKLSALREAALALEQGYKYYYMGYYIHNCKKMRYKGDYKPQYVLDFHSLEWNILDDDMRALMDARKFVDMSRERHRRLSAGPASQENVGQSSEDAITVAPPEDEVLFPQPREAEGSGLSLLRLGMPGVLSLSEVREQIDLDCMRIYLRRMGIHRIRNIQSWGEGSELEPNSLKGIVAEFAAAVGPKVAQEAVIDFG